jgi:hypothetical protein
LQGQERFGIVSVAGVEEFPLSLSIHGPHQVFCSFPSQAHIQKPLGGLQATDSRILELPEDLLVGNLVVVQRETRST